MSVAENGRDSKARLVLNVGLRCGWDHFFPPQDGSSLVRTVSNLHILLCRLMWVKAVPLTIQGHHMASSPCEI